MTDPAPRNQLIADVERLTCDAEMDTPFNDWYMENHERLQKACQRQSVEPPYKDVYVFARAAWKHVEAELQRLREENASKDGKIRDVIHTLSVIASGKAICAEMSANACLVVLGNTLPTPPSDGGSK